MAAAPNSGASPLPDEPAGLHTPLVPLPDSLAGDLPEASDPALDALLGPEPEDLPDPALPSFAPAAPPSPWLARDPPLDGAPPTWL